MEKLNELMDEIEKEFSLIPDDEEDYADEIKLNYRSYGSDKLCSIVVLNRYLNLYEDVVQSVMEELALRREKGDSFEYEKYIESSLNGLPKVLLDVSKLFNIK